MHATHDSWDQHMHLTQTPARNPSAGAHNDRAGADQLVA